jgi:hypothetical protein
MKIYYVIKSFKLVLSSFKRKNVLMEMNFTFFQNFFLKHFNIIFQNKSRDEFFKAIKSVDRNKTVTLSLNNENF